ncbi:MAG: aminotransferase class I/II-fold pyridoxal phosphate-dependent enzyme [Deltaproteobacteria bacterium]|nr:aminotransferase class I/II-fold pyridoxal phosphate-dependent enzyme [Deltaproteobacteria bacterium]
MGIFDKFHSLAANQRALVDSGVNPFNVVIERLISATEAIVNGRHTILAGTNNYLGLTFDPQCIEAAKKAVQDQGTGTTGSRMANGTYVGHAALEREFADFFGYRSAIVFSTGYLANLGMLSVLAGRGDTILVDAHCHASIYDGCRMGSAEIIRFRHNNVIDLEKRLRRLGKKTANTLILVEGIYSMLGDRAPLADIVTLKQKYGAYLLVDEAHSLGVLGEHGRGFLEEAGVGNSMDFIIGTFSKSLGATGGFCVSNHPELDLIRYASRPYIFTASPAPPVIASTRTALKILKTHPELRRRLWRNARHLYQHLDDIGFSLGPEISPIVAVRLPSVKQALVFWGNLLDRGVYVNLALPPATPDSASLVRCSVSAAHTQEQIDYICKVFSDLREGAITLDAQSTAVDSPLDVTPAS